MTPAQDIRGNHKSPRQLEVSSSWTQHNLSTSPTTAFHSPPSSWGGNLASRSASIPKLLKPFNTQDIRILLLENVNQAGRDILSDQGYQVEALKTSLPEDQLIEKIR
jgi:D-3-phosphoglycerate dehydrogenase